MLTDRSPKDRLVSLEDAWLHGRWRGDGMGLLWHLALRFNPMAMTELSRRLDDRRGFADPFSSAGFALRAYRRGDAIAAYNLALGYFNDGNLQGYRHWLRRAARAGDLDAREQLRRFETRLPHGAARDIGRGRPVRDYD